MPGLTLRVGETSQASRDTAFPDLLERLLYLEDYQSEVVFEGVGCQLGRTSYPNYPVKVTENESEVVYVEGEVYRGSLASDPVSIGRNLLEGTADTTELVSNVDGDFIICVVDKQTGQTVIVNDIFGRLPLYYINGLEGFVTGREIQFLIDYLEETDFDDMGIAQMLLFGYTLGDRTLWSRIKKVPPATLIRAQPGTEPVFESLHEFNFDNKVYQNRSVAKNVEALRDRFVEACRVRSNASKPNLISLSGGLDSRAVASAFKSIDLGNAAVTFEYNNNSRDVEIAEELADSLGVPWYLYTLSEINGSDVTTLLQMKNGLNHLGMGYILHFFKELRSDFGSDLTYFTGDGGDKTLPDLTPVQELNEMDELRQYVIDQNSIFSLHETAKLTGLDESLIRDELTSVLSSYPETECKNLYVHYLVHERGFNWLFEGEDRNRYFFWSSSPFYSAPFFRYAMNIPNEQKTHNRLYREFLSALWPPAVKFKDANYGTSLSSERYRVIQMLLTVLTRYPSIKDLVRSIYHGSYSYKSPQTVLSTINTQFKDSPVPRYISEPVFKELFENRSLHDRTKLFNLFTVISVLEKQLGDVSISDRHSGRVYERPCDN